MSSELAETQDNTAIAAQAVQAMPADMAILKLENETIQSLAAARPRNHKQILADIKEQLEAYPSFAEAAIYAKPVGRENDKCGACGVELFRKQGRPQTSCFKCKSTNIVRGEMKFARGLSVRAAEAIAEAYGYCRIRSDVSPIDDDTVKIEATFTDYQKGRIWQDAGIVSKWYKRRDGRMEKIPDDRFYNVTVKAEMSRRVREVITRSVPPGLRSELYGIAETRMKAVLSPEVVDTIIAKYATKKVTLEMIEEHIGRTKAAGWREQDRLHLLSIWNAIEEGETTIAEAFEAKPNDAQKPQDASPAESKPEPGATMDDLAKPQEQPKEKPTKENAPPPKAKDPKPADDGLGDLREGEYGEAIAGSDTVAQVSDLKLGIDADDVMSDAAKARVRELADKRIEALG